jgi:hypothetical protein
VCWRVGDSSGTRDCSKKLSLSLSHFLSLSLSFFFLSLLLLYPLSFCLSVCFDLCLSPPPSSRPPSLDTSPLPCEGWTKAQQQGKSRASRFHSKDGARALGLLPVCSVYAIAFVLRKYQRIVLRRGDIATPRPPPLPPHLPISHQLHG